MNRKQNSAFAIAVAAVTGLGLTAYTVTAQSQSDTDRQDRKQHQDRQSQQVEKPRLPQGIEEGGQADLDGVRGVLRDMTSAAFTDGGFNDVVERFVDQDRNRFGEWMNENDDFEEFDTAVEKLRAAYEEKYGQEIDLDAETAFERIQAVQGEIQDPEQVAGNWPVKPTDDSAIGADDRARLAGDREGAEGANEGVLDSQEDSNIEEGRQVAVVAIAGPEHKPTIRASLVNEFPGTWKVDVPNDQTGQDTYQKLTERIEKLASNTDQWPEDAEKAQQLLAYEVLASIYGVDSEKSGQHRLDVGEEGMPERDYPDQRQQDR